MLWPNVHVCLWILKCVGHSIIMTCKSSCDFLLAIKFMSVCITCSSKKFSILRENISILSCDIFQSSEELCSCACIPGRSQRDIYRRVHQLPGKSAWIRPKISILVVKPTCSNSLIFGKINSYFPFVLKRQGNKIVANAQVKIVYKNMKNKTLYFNMVDCLPLARDTLYRAVAISQHTRYLNRVSFKIIN